MGHAVYKPCSDVLFAVALCYDEGRSYFLHPVKYDYLHSSLVNEFPLLIKYNAEATSLCKIKSYVEFLLPCTSILLLRF